MSWITDNAIKRVFNAFKRSKDKIYKEDIEALKLLNEELVNKNKSYINDNILFAKLLCHVLNQNLHKNNTVKIAIKQTSDILKEPLSYHLEMFKININNKEIESYLTSLNLNLDHFDLKANNDKLLKENQKEIIDKLKTNWTYENVEKSFYNSANDFLKDINNYN